MARAGTVVGDFVADLRLNLLEVFLLWSMTNAQMTTTMQIIATTTTASVTMMYTVRLLPLLSATAKVGVLGSSDVVAGTGQIGPSNESITTLHEASILN